MTGWISFRNENEERTLRYFAGSDDGWPWCR